MKTRNRKLISLLLTAALVFTMNTYTLADETAAEIGTEAEITETTEASTEEGTVEAGEADIDATEGTEEGTVEALVEEGAEAVVEEGVAEEYGEETTAVETDGAIDEVDDFEAEIDARRKPVDGEKDLILDKDGYVVAVSADKVLSANAAKISANLAGVKAEKVGSYYVVYPIAIAFPGKSGLKTAVNNLTSSIKVYKPAAGKTDKDLISNNKVSGNLAGSFTLIATTKVKIKNPAAATVDLAGLSITNKTSQGCYVKEIKTSDKAVNKEIKNALKGSKGSKLNIMVYPMYAGNDPDAIELAKVQGLATASVTLTNGKKAKAKGTGADGKKITIKESTKAAFKKYFMSAGSGDVSPTKGKSYYAARGNAAGNIFY